MTSNSKAVTKNHRFNWYTKRKTMSGVALHCVYTFYSGWRGTLVIPLPKRTDEKQQKQRFKKVVPKEASRHTGSNKQITNRQTNEQINKQQENKPECNILGCKHFPSDSFDRSLGHGAVPLSHCGHNKGDGTVPLSHYGHNKGHGTVPLSHCGYNKGPRWLVPQSTFCAFTEVLSEALSQTQRPNARLYLYDANCTLG